MHADASEYHRCEGPAPNGSCVHCGFPVNDSRASDHAAAPSDEREALRLRSVIANAVGAYADSGCSAGDVMEILKAEVTVEEAAAALARLRDVGRGAEPSRG